MNDFADLTNEEFGAKYLMKNFNSKSGESTPGATNKCTGAQAPDTNIPDSIDWSTKGFL